MKMVESGTLERRIFLNHMTNTKSILKVKDEKQYKGWEKSNLVDLGKRAGRSERRHVTNLHFQFNITKHRQYNQDLAAIRSLLWHL